MRKTFRPLVWVAGILGVAVLTPAVRAQGPGAPLVSPFPALTIRPQTTVFAPNRGQVGLGGYNSTSEGRNEFGSPLGRGPYLGRGSRNIGYGRSMSAGRAVLRVR